MGFPLFCRYNRLWKDQMASIYKGHACRNLKEFEFTTLAHTDKFFAAVRCPAGQRSGLAVLHQSLSTGPCQRSQLSPSFLNHGWPCCSSIASRSLHSVVHSTLTTIQAWLNHEEVLWGSKDNQLLRFNVRTLATRNIPLTPLPPGCRRPHQLQNDYGR